MKNCKQRQVGSKRPRNILEEVQHGEMSASNCKYASNHTKISTNCTIHSTVGLHPAPEKRTRNRKNGKSSAKENPPEAPPLPPHSKSGRKVKKCDVPLNLGVSSFDAGQQSCRQYCVVQENFVPITDFKQQKVLQDMFVKTATTSCDKNFFGLDKKTSKAKLRKRSMSTERQQEPSNKNTQKSDKAVSNIQHPVQWATTQVQAKVQSSEIGMQYSERKVEIAEKEQEEEDKGKEVDKEEQAEEEDKEGQAEEKGRDSLTDLLFKLEFSHLGDDNSFTHLNSNQKQHFTQLLETVIQKLRPARCTNKIKPIAFDQASPQPPHPAPEERSPGSRLQEEKLEGLLVMRQSTQLNCVEDNFNYSENSQVNTSLMSILNFLGYLFCHIEVHYSEEFVYMIRKMYGLPFREKYKRITRKMSLASNTKFKVVDESIFEDMVNDHSGTQYNYHQIVHFKAVFDAFNEHLDEYRPYYLGNGEQFPWAFKMFTTMSEYSIDQQSLQIIFRQAKDKVVEWATLLCGIHLNLDQPLGIHLNLDQPLAEGNPLELKRGEKENKMISSWIAEQNFTKDGIELYSTQVLHEAAEQLYSQLLQQFIEEAGFIFN